MAEVPVMTWIQLRAFWAVGLISFQPLSLTLPPLWILMSVSQSVVKITLLGLRHFHQPPPSAPPVPPPHRPAAVMPEATACDRWISSLHKLDVATLWHQVAPMLLHVLLHALCLIALCLFFLLYSPEPSWTSSGQGQESRQVDRYPSCFYVGRQIIMFTVSIASGKESL